MQRFLTEKSVHQNQLGEAAVMNEYQGTKVCVLFTSLVRVTTVLLDALKDIDVS